MMQENNRTELERLDKERHSDFLNMLKGFVVNQVCLILLFSIWWHGITHLGIYAASEP